MAESIFDTALNTLKNIITEIVSPKTEFWLFHNSERYQFPVNPETYTMSASSNNQTVTVYKTGEINLWGPENLKTISIQSFFPNPDVGNKYACMYGNPWDTVKMINRWRNDGYPTRLMITGTDINMECLIDSFEYGGSGGIGDVNFTIAFKEYKRLQVPIDYAGTNTSSTSDTTPARPTPSTSSSNGKYTVVSGDCLWNIAKKYYNDGSQWTKIWDANQPMTSGNPNLIYPGEVVTIP